ncbi:MAG: exodeoxyribonuclease VII small subunit [Methylococcus sp.]|jgi:exodeoxyribonuclease VII small subunit|nr:MAG: exodeoxyribonuclease VII small subunit [Methylococcus sp.]
MAKKTTQVPFEKSLQELEQLVEHLEKGDIPLEDSLQCFERGIQLTRACQKALQEAEQKVEILLQDQGNERLKPFSDES